MEQNELTELIERARQGEPDAQDTLVRMAQNRVYYHCKNFLGYRKGENGEPEIVPEEAEIVRRIYRLFLEGQTPYGVKRVLEEEHIPAPAGEHGDQRHHDQRGLDLPGDAAKHRIFEQFQFALKEF